MARILKTENGYALLSFIVIMAIGALVVGAALARSSTYARTAANTRIRSERFYEAETALNRGLSWARENSQSLIKPFMRDQFYSSFTLTSPSVGTNDTSIFQVPTRIKVHGTSQSALLTTSTLLGSAQFPPTAHIASNASFNATSEFQSFQPENTVVRMTLVDALAVDPSKDYGPPPAAAPETDFYPIYRIDVMNALDRGAHLFGYVIGSLRYIDTVGFYGRDFVEALQSCDSYNSADGAYGAGNRGAKCPVGSHGPIRIHQNEEIYGSVRTNGTIDQTTPYGGKVCADFAANCPNEGNSCQGTACQVPGLPTFQNWATYCPTDQGNRTISANTTWTLGGGAPSQNCWNTVTVNTNRTLTLTSTNHPYYIRTLNFANDSNSRLRIIPSPATGVVTLYVENFSGGQINGNQMFNVNNRPSQLRLYYLGATPLTLNGNADMNAAIVAPNAGVTVSGNFRYQGGILATNLTFSGSGELHYDESLGGTYIDDMTFRLRGEIEYYR